MLRGFHELKSMRTCFGIVVQFRAADEMLFRPGVRASGQTLIHQSFFSELYCTCTLDKTNQGFGSRYALNVT